MSGHRPNHVFYPSVTVFCTMPKYDKNNCQLSTVNCQLKRAAAGNLRQLFVFMRLLLSVNGALTAILALALELDGTVNQSEQGVILADTNVGAGMDVGASLANQDVASQDELTVSTLAAQSLGLGITAVLGGTAALVVSEELNANLQHMLHQTIYHAFQVPSH